MSTFLSCSFVLTALFAFVFCYDNSLFDLFEDFKILTDLRCLKSNFTVQFSGDGTYAVKTVNAFYPMPYVWSLEEEVDKVERQLKGVDLEFFHLFIFEMRNFHLLDEREKHHFKDRISDGDFGLSLRSTGVSQKNISDALEFFLKIARHMIQLNETSRINQKDWGYDLVTNTELLKSGQKKHLIFDDPEVLAKEPVFGLHLFSGTLVCYILVPLFDSSCNNPAYWRELFSTNDLPQFYRIHRYFNFLIFP